MNKIINIDQAIHMSKTIHAADKTIVLSGGCFDILHMGHITLFEKAKQQGDILVIFLESDEKIKQLKGDHRPLHTQAERAYMLSAISFIDYIICLPFFTSHEDYTNLIATLRPSVIAITKGDTMLAQKQHQAQKIGAILAEVVEYIPQKSTSVAVQTILNEK
jgi:rfaE bifunctional protein nucleotidyltransferase chain/domain